MRRLTFALAGLALVAGCGGSPGEAPPQADVPPVTMAAAAPAAAGVPDPVSLDIPKIGAHSTLEPSGRTPDGGWEVAPLTEPMQATWFQPGPEPGDPGPSVILGHVNGDHRPGIFARLHELAAGDLVEVTDTAGTVRRFAVSRVEQQPKEAFDAATVLAPSATPELRLITCGGELRHTATGGSYVDNWIVYATLA